MKSSSNYQQLKERAPRQKQLGHSDELTGLPNRALLEGRLQKATAQAKHGGDGCWRWCASVLEGLEAIRERHGRRGGDEVLATLAARAMKRTMSKGDPLRLALKATDSAKIVRS